MGVLRPPKRLSMSDWADNYRMLSRETSAEPGRWRTSRAPYQKGIMDAISDRSVETVVLMTSAQVGKALDVATPILTTEGWRTMGDIAVGDVVYSLGRRETEVVFVSSIMEGRRCFCLEFSDGGEVVCDGEHLWRVVTEEGETDEVSALEILAYEGRLFLVADDGETAEERFISAIYEVPSRPVRCIQVDDKSHLYLCGENCYPTHNTEVLLNTVGYFMSQDPSSMLVFQPTQDMAETFSKDRVQTMLRDTPILSELVITKGRDTRNSIGRKEFPGGTLQISGANSPAALASRSARIILADEVDRFPMSAGNEGDPIHLAIKRANTFWNRKIVLVSTPTVKGASRIEQEFLTSSREEWTVACPNCGHYQPYTWAAIHFNPDDATRPVTMECAHCGEEFEEFSWKRQPGRWEASAQNPKKRGFHLNELASPWKRWREVVDDFLEMRHRPEDLQVFVNTSLGESWEIPTEVSYDYVLKRRERYDAEVPDGAVLLTAGVDTQDDRLEVEVVGWGLGRESWGIAYRVFHGDPREKGVWEKLDAFLLRGFSRQDGTTLHISAACVDSGGHCTTEVYRFTKAREHRLVFSIKGKGGTGVPVVSRPSVVGPMRAKLYHLGVDALKSALMGRLKQEFVGPGYCHFPINPESGYTQLFFEGLTSETRRVVKKKGRAVVTWEVRPGVRNEPLDCRNYATAAMEILNPDFETLAKMIGGDVERVSRRKRRRGLISKGV